MWSGGCEPGLLPSWLTPCDQPWIAAATMMQMPSDMAATTMASGPEVCSRAASTEPTSHHGPLVTPATAGEMTHIKEVAVLALNAFLYRAAHHRRGDHHDVAEVPLPDTLAGS